MKRTSNEHDEKMGNLNSNHQRLIEEMKNSREKDRFAHEKEMQNIEISKKK